MINLGRWYCWARVLSQTSMFSHIRSFTKSSCFQRNMVVLGVLLLLFLPRKQGLKYSPSITSTINFFLICLFLKGKTDTISISWTVEALRVVVTKCNFHFKTNWKYVWWHPFCLIYFWSNLLVGSIVHNYNWKSVGDNIGQWVWPF